MLFHSLDKHRDTGLLVLRIGIGVMFMIHGFPKLLAGPALWAKLGGTLSVVGIGFAPTFWGLMAALSEFGGGMLLAVGLFTRPAAFFMLMTMIVATLMHLQHGHPFKVYSHALEAAILFASFILIGPGRFSIDTKLYRILKPK